MYEPAITDEDLVHRSREGDESAFRALLDRWLPAMRAQVRRRLRGGLRRRVAESDVVQEAYLTAFLKMGDFEARGEGSFGRWLGRIVELKLHEQVRQHVGTRKRDIRAEASVPAGVREAQPAKVATPSLHAMRLEETDALRQAMDRLPEQYRTVLQFAYHQRLRVAEIGRILERSEAAAGMLLARALRALGKLLVRREGS